MGQFNKTNYKNYANPILFAKGLKTVAINTTYAKLPANLMIKKGTYCSLLEDGSGNEYLLLHKSAKVYEAVTADTALKVYKEHSFGVGDTIYDGSTAVTVNAIDTDTYDDYDLITTSANVTFLVNEIIYNLEDPSFKLLSSPINFVAEDVIFETGDTVNVVVSAMGVLDVWRLPNYWDGITYPFNSPNTGVVVIPTNKDIAIPSLKQYKEYVALVSQAATADPTAKELIDETGRTYTYTRNSAGIYTITVSPAFDDADKVFASISSNAQNRNMAVEVNSTTAIYIYQDDLAAAATDAFDDVSLEIRIY